MLPLRAVPVLGSAPVWPIAAGAAAIQLLRDRRPRQTRSSGPNELAMYRIRFAVISDAPMIGRVHVLGWRAAYAHLLPRDVLDDLSEQERARSWERILTQAPHGTLVAEQDGQLLGFASVGPGHEPDAAARKRGELYALYVDPQHWSTGVGWRLWSAARQQLADEGYAEVTLWVLEGNARGRGFYERVGFSLDPTGREIIEIGGVSLPEVRYHIRIAASGERSGVDPDA